MLQNESLEASGATWSTYVAPGRPKTISEEKWISHLVQNGGQFGSILGAFWLIIAVQGRPKVENCRFLGILFSVHFFGHFLMSF